MKYLSAVGRSPFLRPGSRASMGKGVEPFTPDSDISFVSSGRRSVDRGFPSAWNSGGDSYRLSNGSELEIFSPGPASPSPIVGVGGGGGGGRKSVDNHNYNASSNTYPQEMSSCSLESETFSWASYSNAQVTLQISLALSSLFLSILCHL